MTSPGTLPNTNLPVQRDLLIGREREVGAIRHLLLREDVGLVTLTGPGGTGKTRLALRVAADLLDTFRDGVYVVSLASIMDPELVASTIGGVLGIKEAGDQPFLGILENYLYDKQLLLLLDNFEQVLDAAPQVADLLATCPGLTVLATGRAALHLTGEHTFPVPPLELPAAREIPDIRIFAANASVALFLRRAQAVRPDFTLTPTNARSIAEICIRLDGLPLAIELAAARLKLLTPEALLTRLSNRLDTLSGGARDLPERQQTLRNTITWSHDQLTSSEQHMFRRLAPFVGGFTLDAAGEVSAEQSSSDAVVDLLDAISSLVDINLLRRATVTGAEPRFEMLETIREYALEQLEASEEAEEMRKRHALYYLALSEQAEPAFFGGESTDWLVRLERDHDNIRAALQWTSAHDQACLLLRLTGALAWFWYDRGHLNEGRRWISRALDKANHVPAAARAKALIGAGGLAHRQFDLEPAQEYLEAGLQLSRELSDSQYSALALINLGLVAHDQGDYVRARRLHEESLALSREAQDDWGIGISLNNLGWTALFAGNYEEGHAMAEAALALRRELGDRLGIANSLYTLGRIAQAEGLDARAEKLLKKSMQLFYDLGDQWGMAACLESLAITYANHRGDLASAARLWGAAEALRETLGAPLTQADRRIHKDHQDDTRTKIGQERWNEAWATGRASSIDDLLNEIVEEPPTAEAAGTHPTSLTNREIEVLQLVAEGLTNAEVGEQLYISPRTVGQHLRSIYSKLDVNSRTAAARFAIDHNLI